MSASKPYHAILTLTALALGAVAAHRAVGFNGAQATVRGQKVLGIAASAAAEGEAYPVVAIGTMVAETGAAIAAGDDLITDTQGRVVPVSAVVDLAITAATKASPGVITAAGHGLQTGDKVAFTGVGGMVELHNKVFVVTRIDADTFSIGVDTSGYTTYTAGGTVTKVSSDNVIARALESASGSGKFIEVLIK